MTDYNSSSGIGLLGLIIAYAIHLWAVANGYELLATVTWWYCTIYVVVSAIIILVLIAAGAILVCIELFKIYEKLVGKRRK